MTSLTGEVVHTHGEHEFQPSWPARVRDRIGRFAAATGLIETPKVHDGEYYVPAESPLQGIEKSAATSRELLTDLTVKINTIAEKVNEKLVLLHVAGAADIIGLTVQPKDGSSPLVRLNEDVKVLGEMISRLETSIHNAHTVESQDDAINRKIEEIQVRIDKAMTLMTAMLTADMMASADKAAENIRNAQLHRSRNDIVVPGAEVVSVSTQITLDADTPKKMQQLYDEIVICKLERAKLERALSGTDRTYPFLQQDAMDIRVAIIQLEEKIKGYEQSLAHQSRAFLDASQSMSAVSGAGATGA